MFVRRSSGPEQSQRALEWSACSGLPSLQSCHVPPLYGCISTHALMPPPHRTAVLWSVKHYALQLYIAATARVSFIFFAFEELEKPLILYTK